MSFLTNNKDVNILILLKLKSIDIRNVLLVNKVCSKYNNEVLWMNYWHRRVDWICVTNCNERSWKEFSLLLFGCCQKAISTGVDISEIPDNRYYWNQCMAKSAEGGHRNLINFFIVKGSDQWNWAMASAARGGHRDLVDFFISKGADDWHYGMNGAAQGGHRDLVDFFISKGANDWNWGMRGAAQGGHRDLVDFFISQGADDWSCGMIGAEKGKRPKLIKFFRKLQDQKLHRV